MIPGVVDNRVTIDIVDGIADVRMNRPDKRNALDGAMFAGLAEAGDELTMDYDRDGDADLYVANFGANRLYRNRGDGTFEFAREFSGSTR